MWTGDWSDKVAIVGKAIETLEDGQMFPNYLFDSYFGRRGKYHYAMGGALLKLTCILDLTSGSCKPEQ
jgi:hypothetical protein